MKTVGSILVIIITIYSWLLLIRLFLSFFKFPEQKWLLWLKQITDPIFDFLKDRISLKIAGINISYILPFIILLLLRHLIEDLMILELPFDFFYMTILIVKVIDDFFIFICFSLFIGTIILVVLSRYNPINSHPFIATLRIIITPFINYIKKGVKTTSKNPDLVYLIILAIIILFVLLIGQTIFAAIINLLGFGQSISIKKLHLD